MSGSRTAEQFLNEGAIARCGINCHFCASYAEHVKTDADKQRCSDVWLKFMGFHVDPATIRPCPGCESSAYYGEDGADGADCAIRKCARTHGVKTCTHCSRYLSGCSLHHGAGEEADDAGKPAPEATTDAERLFFGDLGHAQGNRSPEENLAEIRASLEPEDIVHADE
ncbi:MAG: DUF3795 domain-containing protein [Lentisphaerae bacterium]|jgi:hypothetical protein|nr:DUF3795 domain-containing protein [Lentisphaerota bacterium]MBT4817839.1 DUF3795 domain-containing protein [Lentisphaerota bacterium]MBT5612232.1 DUF3795 domain-containing protein [Lentisphaerota bacterium]